MNVAELAYHQTPLGDLTPRRRKEPLLHNREVFEVKLGDAYLMSSLFTESEEQLAHLGLADLEGNLDVVIGGLGLGYTAAAALANKRVSRLLIIDVFSEILEWHRKELVPLGRSITRDHRCELRHGDFFELARTGFGGSDNDRLFDSILLDIDHSPDFVLNEKTRSFYSEEGFSDIAKQLNDDGSFALWSNDMIDDRVAQEMETVFKSVIVHVVAFPNPYTLSPSNNFVYVARKTSN